MKAKTTLMHIAVSKKQSSKAIFLISSIFFQRRLMYHIECTCPFILTLTADMYLIHVIGSFNYRLQSQARCVDIQDNDLKHNHNLVIALRIVCLVAKFPCHSYYHEILFSSKTTKPQTIDFNTTYQLDAPPLPTGR